MIKVEHLSFSYGREPFIEDMSFDVKRGEIFGFLGPSGAGKSTLENNKYNRSGIPYREGDGGNGR